MKMWLGLAAITTCIVSLVSGVSIPLALTVLVAGFTIAMVGVYRSNHIQDRLMGLLVAWWLLTVSFGGGVFYLPALIVAALGPVLVVKRHGGFRYWEEETLTIVAAGIPMLIHFPVANSLAQLLGDGPFAWGYLLLVVEASWWGLLPVAIIPRKYRRTRLSVSLAMATILTLLLFQLVSTEPHYQDYWGYWGSWTRLSVWFP